MCDVHEITGCSIVRKVIHLQLVYYLIKPCCDKINSEAITDGVLQSASQRRRRKLYKWSVVGALVLLLGVVVVAVALLVSKNTSSVRSRIYPTNSTKIASSSRLTNFSATLSYTTSGKGGTDHITGNTLQDGKKSELTRRTTSSNGLFNIVETC